MTTHNQLLVVKKSPQATLPIRSSEGAAGYDLSSAKEMVIPARGKGLVPTDLVIAVPDGTYGRIAPRSGLAWKNHIDVGAGVIDSDYRGPVGVVLFNHSEVDFKIAVGDRIAQLIFEQIKIVPVKEVESIEETSRGEGGFGSTGVSTAPRYTAPYLEFLKYARIKDEQEKQKKIVEEEWKIIEKDIDTYPIKDASGQDNTAFISTMKKVLDTCGHRTDLPIVRSMSKFIKENSEPGEEASKKVNKEDVSEVKKGYAPEMIEALKEIVHTSPEKSNPIIQGIDDVVKKSDESDEIPGQEGGPYMILCHDCRQPMVGSKVGVPHICKYISGKKQVGSVTEETDPVALDARRRLTEAFSGGIEIISMEVEKDKEESSSPPREPKHVEKSSHTERVTTQEILPTYEVETVKGAGGKNEYVVKESSTVKVVRTTFS